MAIAGLVAAFVTLWNKSDAFRNFFIGMWEGIKKAVGAAIGFVKENWQSMLLFLVNPLAGVFKLLYDHCDGFRNFFKGFINSIINGINSMIRGLNKLSFTVPDWVPDIGGKSLGFNIPLIPKLAEGGVVDKATLAMIGEAGKEVVMPLENNTQWIDKLADRISAKSGGRTTNNTVNNYFERMETSRHALHKANLETRRILAGV
jgi:phage-related protein